MPSLRGNAIRPGPSITLAAARRLATLSDRRCPGCGLRLSRWLADNGASWHINCAPDDAETP